MLQFLTPCVLRREFLHCNCCECLTVTSIDKSIKDKHDEHTDDGHEEHELQDGQKHDEHGGEGADEHDDHESEHAHDKGESENKDDEEHDESASASLDSNQMALANIKVSTLSPKIVNYTLYAPGEIFSNGYSSYRVSPRVASVVTRRHVALGDRVNKGQVLVTLFSETVAQAQANYRTTYPEWERVGFAFALRLVTSASSFCVSHCA